jgi:hypothetical protein
MSYSSLSKYCMGTQSSLTNNAKYIEPTDDVYNKTITDMLYYPGRINMHSLEIDSHLEKSQAPESVKAFQLNSSNKGPINCSCKACSTQS